MFALFTCIPSCQQVEIYCSGYLQLVTILMISSQLLHGYSTKADKYRSNIGTLGGKHSFKIYKPRICLSNKTLVRIEFVSGVNSLCKSSFTT